MLDTANRVQKRVDVSVKMDFIFEQQANVDIVGTTADYAEFDEYAFGQQAAALFVFRVEYFAQSRTRVGSARICSSVVRLEADEIQSRFVFDFETVEVLFGQVVN